MNTKTRTRPEARAASSRGTPTRTSASYLLLLAVIVVLNLIGLVMILSASSVTALQYEGSSYYYFERQLLWLFAGSVVFLISLRIDYRLWRKAGRSDGGRERVAARRRAVAGHRPERERLVALDRCRHVRHPTVRVRQARDAGVRRRPAGSPRVVDQRHARHAAPGHGRLRLVRRCSSCCSRTSARRSCSPPSPSPCCSSPAHRSASLAGWGFGRLLRRGHRVDGRELPPRSHLRVSAPVERPAEHRLPDDPVAGERRIRGLVRCRPRRVEGEVGLPAVRAHRLHLRHHQRRARARGRHGCRAGCSSRSASSASARAAHG